MPILLSYEIGLTMNLPHSRWTESSSLKLMSSIFKPDRWLNEVIPVSLKEFRPYNFGKWKLTHRLVDALRIVTEDGMPLSQLSLFDFLTLIEN
jgi:hypothetical protein